MTRQRTTTRRDRAIEQATRRLNEAHAYILRAIDEDDQLTHIDSIGGLELAYAADSATAAIRRMSDGQKWARQRRRDMERQMAQEVRT